MVPVRAAPRTEQSPRITTTSQAHVSRQPREAKNPRRLNVRVSSIEGAAGGTPHRALSAFWYDARRASRNKPVRLLGAARIQVLSQRAHHVDARHTEVHFPNFSLPCVCKPRLHNQHPLRLIATTLLRITVTSSHDAFHSERLWI